MSPQGDYLSDREWSDSYIEQIKAIVGPYVLEPSPFEIDTKNAADLMVLQNKSVKVACRLRRPGYERFYGEFTIRSNRASGVKTELAKIVDGWGDWLFYGHIRDENELIHPWYLLDLHVFRAALIRQHASIISKTLSNTDGVTCFKAYRIDSFPSEIVIASSVKLEQGALAL
ncbi:hypothetical protein AMK68_00255 [candidate division KD3-62 bacterium DG_56]|uniref:Uncharacterized protein n=1 Tax=candidate division KD3-62 bacterium DG_56 TaxID=1704032 RepID=A0A0S7XRM7_9BACT|nr:MAG: hypothetical protein AMK68_00255 [candidate division KD3-62 bacterium DG_56]